MKIKNILTILVLGIFLMGSVSAFAVSSKYWDENPVVMNPGEQREISIFLQNMAGDVDIEAEGRITNARDIVDIPNFEKNYQVPLGTKTEVKILLKIPKTGFQERYILTTSFKTKAAGAGNFGLGAGIERSIPIVITKKPQAEAKLNTTYYIIAALIIIIAGLVIFILTRKKKGKKKRK